ncbi:MAG TPA: acyl carrier protein [Candidatus Scatomorpha stercoravium]|nr:acyl carrier protein [Candidatus Scatomorpha stercoravium]
MFETVKKVLAEQLEVDPALITPDTDIMDDLGADSLDLVELVMSLEERYDIVLTDDKTASVRTVGQVVKMLEGIIK